MGNLFSLVTDAALATALVWRKTPTKLAIFPQSTSLKSRRLRHKLGTASTVFSLSDILVVLRFDSRNDIGKNLINRTATVNLTVFTLLDVVVAKGCG
jgi:hypothetical protein